MLPSLVRPSVPNDKPNEDLVLWGTNYYNYCVIAHLRVVLRGIVDLINLGNVPTAFVACRHVYEWTAHTCYMSKTLGDHIAKQEWAEAGQLQSRVMEANRWVKEHGEKYEPSYPYDEMPDQLRLKRSLAAYAEYQIQTYGASDVADSYALLSEHSHPNSACFNPYCRFSGAEVRFVRPSADAALLGEERCLIDLVQFLHKMLLLGKERTVLPQVRAIIDQIIAASKTVKEKSS